MCLLPRPPLWITIKLECWGSRGLLARFSKKLKCTRTRATLVFMEASIESRRAHHGDVSVLSISTQSASAVTSLKTPSSLDMTTLGNSAPSKGMQPVPSHPPPFHSTKGAPTSVGSAPRLVANSSKTCLLTLPSASLTTMRWTELSWQGWAWFAGVAWRWPQDFPTGI